MCAMLYNRDRAPLPGLGAGQIGAPPPVQFQPQPSWGGIDFFRAHAATADPALFNQVYNNISGASGALASLGVGFNEAQIWHQRAYGGLGTINTLSPQEIGYAAAYEAYRLWIHNSVLYEPLGGEMERQREALVGLAIAEG
ncbi:hypothetical protein HYDPIDRAFT_108462 [Hydnomerulius pinastri MD-312]|nr:hypothetical protein HYDPIDRAFT_108462 [Hydnomerulius pinastri MD-312]